jgi:Tol biopolymer transport system component
MNHRRIIIDIARICIGVGLAGMALAGEIAERLPDATNCIGQTYHARVSPTGKELWLTITDPASDDDLYLAPRSGRGWGRPVKLDGRFNDNQRNLSPSVTGDGKRLFFVSYNRTGGPGFQIWQSTSHQKGWSDPTNCGPAVNTGSEVTACISADGRKLYFSSGRTGGMGDYDLYCSEWDTAGKSWNEPHNLGPNVNTTSREYDPWISADGETLLWASWDSGERGPAVFSSHRLSDGWSPAVKLPAPVNRGGRYWSDSPSLSPDGKWLYFSTDFPDSNAQYQFLWRCPADSVLR